MLNGKLLSKIKKKTKMLIGYESASPTVHLEPDMNFQRRIAVKEAIANVSTAVRFEPATTPIAQSLKGDYMEFGVFQGAMFKFVLREAGEKMPWMRFYACDSFEGLPEPTGIDAHGEFVAGQFSCSKDDFVTQVSGQNVEENRIFTVPGWFCESLKEQAMSIHDIKIVSIAYVDCDLYESCVPVLEFLTSRLRQGSVILFDDWYCFRADPNRGIPLAVKEWLTQNQNLELIPWKPFSSHGLSFFVRICG